MVAGSGSAQIFKASQGDWSLSFMRQRAVFFDRDGVINVNHGYVHRVEEFQFIDGIFEAVSYTHLDVYKRQREKWSAAWPRGTTSQLL